MSHMGNFHTCIPHKDDANFDKHNDFCLLLLVRERAHNYDIVFLGEVSSNCHICSGIDSRFVEFRSFSGRSIFSMILYLLDFCDLTIFSTSAKINISCWNLKYISTNQCSRKWNRLIWLATERSQAVGPAQTSSLNIKRKSWSSCSFLQ